MDCSVAIGCSPCRASSRRSGQLGRQPAGGPEIFLDLLERWRSELAEHHQVQDLGEGVLDERFDRLPAVVEPARLTVDKTPRSCRPRPLRGPSEPGPNRP